MTAGAMPTRFGGGKKPINLGEPQIVPPAFMRIGSYIEIIFDISPCRLLTGRYGNIKNTRELAELAVIETLRKAYSVKSEYQGLWRASSSATRFFSACRIKSSISFTRSP